MQLISSLLILISHIRSDRETMVLRNTPLEASPNNNKMMLLEIAVLNKKIAEGISCCFCSKSITAEEKLPANSNLEYTYFKFSIDYFCCPKCEAISHIDCFLTQNKFKKLPCNRCGMQLLSNDTNRLFSQLIYVYASKSLWFRDFKILYNCYIHGSKEYKKHNVRNVSQSQIMKILIESKTLIYMDQKYLWDFLSEYFSNQDLNHRSHFTAYFTILDQQKTDVVKTYTRTPEKEKQELIETGNVLISINALQSQLVKTLAPMNFLQIYKNCFEQKAFSSEAEKHLGEHAVYFIMGLDNSFLYMEEMLIEMLNSKDLVIEEELTAEVMDSMAKNPHAPEFLKKRTYDPLALNFLRSILSELKKNNIFMINAMTENYIMSENKGVLMPILINFFVNNQMESLARKIIVEQLKAIIEVEVIKGVKVEFKVPFKEMSVKNTMYVIKAARRLGKPLNREYVEQILNWIYLLPKSLGIENLIYISSYLQSCIANLQQEQYNDLQDIFARFYSHDTAIIYVRCMCTLFYTYKNFIAFAEKAKEYQKELKKDPLEELEELKIELKIKHENEKQPITDWWDEE